MATRAYDFQSIQTSSAVGSTSYGSAKSDEYDVSGEDEALFIFSVDAGASMTSFEAKLEVEDDDGNWYSLYRSNSGTLELEEVTLTTTPLSTDNEFAISVDTKALRNCRWKYKGTGGNPTVTMCQISRAKDTN